MNALRIVLVEDDEALREGLKEYLQLSGCQVTAVPSGLEFFAALTSEPEFQLAVVDLGLPDVDGQRLVEHLRQHTRVKIIVLTANQTAGARIDSYTAGADLYMGKPVDPRELAAALRSLGGRQEPAQTSRLATSPASVATTPAWRLDKPRRRLISPEGKDVQLSPIEYRLMELLRGAHGETLARETILLALYKRDEESAHKVLEVLVGRLRRKLAGISAAAPILTAYGVGYSFSEPID